MANLVVWDSDQGSTTCISLISRPIFKGEFKRAVVEAGVPGCMAEEKTGALS